MLAIDRYRDEGFTLTVPGLTGPIKVKVLKCGGRRIRLGIDAPRSVQVLRDDAINRKRKNEAEENDVSTWIKGPPTEEGKFWICYNGIGCTDIVVLQSMCRRAVGGGLIIRTAFNLVEIGSCFILAHAPLAPPPEPPEEQLWKATARHCR